MGRGRGPCPLYRVMPCLPFYISGGRVLRYIPTPPRMAVNCGGAVNCCSTFSGAVNCCFTLCGSPVLRSAHDDDPRIPSRPHALDCVLDCTAPPLQLPRRMRVTHPDRQMYLGHAAPCVTATPLHMISDRPHVTAVSSEGGANSKRVPLFFLLGSSDLRACETGPCRNGDLVLFVK